MNGRPISVVQSVRPHDLTDLPNITILLGEALQRVGITSIADLVAVGAENAWNRLGEAGIHLDAHVLLALEGAIEGVPWRDLPRMRRCELLHWLMHAGG